MKGYDIPTTGTTHDSVFGAEAIGIQGNVIPPQWLRHLVYPSGKPYMIAAFILSDIVYWYRPVVVRDEVTGQVLGYRKKFEADKLQRNYQAIADMYGFTKREVADACYYLRDSGFIDLDLRNIHSSTGLAINNVLYIGLNAGAVKEITVNVIYHTPKGNILSPEALPTPTPKSDTNTETPTETPSESDTHTGENLDPIAHLIAAAQRGVSEATAPNPADQWFAYSQQFLKAFQNKTKRYPNDDEKDAITSLSYSLHADIAKWELSLTECNTNFTGHKLPAARVIEVYNAGGTWAKWQEWKNKQNGNGNGKARIPMRHPLTNEIIEGAFEL